MPGWPATLRVPPVMVAVVDPRLAADLAELPALLDRTGTLAQQALAGLVDRPVATTFRPEQTPLPEHGSGTAATLAEFERRWAPGLSASAGPRYLGFVTGGVTPAALAGDWLTGTYDQNVVTTRDSAAAALEHETVGWLRELFGLSDEFTGAFVSGATMSTVVGLAIGREWLGERRNVFVADAGVGALGESPCSPVNRIPVSTRRWQYWASGATRHGWSRHCPVARPSTSRPCPTRSPHTTAPRSWWPTWAP